MSYCSDTNSFVASIEERNNAAALRQRMIDTVKGYYLPDDVLETVTWMICQVSEEAIIRKQRRADVERWFENVISQLEPGTTFTQRGLLEEFDAPEKVCKYASFILTEWASSRRLIKHTSQPSFGLMATTISVNVYEVL